MTNCPKCDHALRLYQDNTIDIHTAYLLCVKCDWRTPSIGDFAEVWWNAIGHLGKKDETPKCSAGRVDKAPEFRIHVSGMPQVVYGPREGE